MTRQQVFSIVFFALVVLLLYQIGLMFKPFVFSALWAGLLAHWAFPLHLRLTRLFAGKEMMSAAILTIGAMAIVVVPLVVMGVMLVREASVAEQEIRVWISGGGLQRLPEELATIPIIGGWLKSALAGSATPTFSLEQSVMTGVKELSQFLIGGMGGLLKNTFALIVNFFMMLLILFFLFKDGQQWLSVLYDLIPMEESHKSKILVRLDQTIRAVVKGVLVTAIVQGLLAGMAYLALGVPFPMGLTALTIVVAPIPFGGTGLVWLPVALYLFWVGMAGKALAMLAWGIGVVSMVDQFLRPWLIGQDVQIPVLLLVLSVLGGLALYGLLGLFIGPILISLLMTAVQIYREEYHLKQVAHSANPPASP
ncbi:MAG: AI-2E family transporter [Nitrospira sp.]|nr:AI-2E family transporter [Nitrospira sp.]MDH4245421.1 AI-2E family transporter [Nitrospira sp.]MDH5320584.1 AI-2E family transporter [Nitrospira sp.]